MWKSKRGMSTIQRLIAKGMLHANTAGDDTGGGGGDNGTGGAADVDTGGAADVDTGGAGDDEAAKKAAAAAAAAKTGPTDAEAKLLKEVMDKKAALKVAKDEAAALKAKLQQFDGVDLDAVKALLAEKKTAETKKLEEKGEWDRLKDQMKSEFQKQLDIIQATVAEKDKQLEKYISSVSELTVGNAFAGSQVIKDELTIPQSKVRVLYGSHFGYEDGVLVGYDKPAGASERTMLVDASGDALPFELALKKIIDADPDRDQLYRSKSKPGTGSKTAAKTSSPERKLDKPRGVEAIASALNSGTFKR